MIFWPLCGLTTTASVSVSYWEVLLQVIHLELGSSPAALIHYPTPALDTAPPHTHTAAVMYPHNKHIHTHGERKQHPLVSYYSYTCRLQLRKVRKIVKWFKRIFLCEVILCSYFNIPVIYFLLFIDKFIHWFVYIFSSLINIKFFNISFDIIFTILINIYKCYILNF